MSEESMKKLLFRFVVSGCAIVSGFIVGKWDFDRDRISVIGPKTVSHANSVSYSHFTAETQLDQPLKGDESDYLIFTTFHSWFPLDRDFVLDQMATLSREQKLHATAGLLIAAAERDPLALIELIDSLPANPFIVAAAFETAARHDLDRSLEIWSSLPDRWKETATNGIGAVIAEGTFEEAFGIISQVEDQKLHKLLLRATAMSYAQRGEIDLLSSSIGKAFRQSVSDMNDTTSAHDREALEDKSFLARLEYEIVNAMALRDPLLAAQWIHEGKTSQTPIAAITPHLFNEPASVVMQVLGYADDRERAMRFFLSELPELSEDRLMEFMNIEEDPKVLRTMVGWYGGLNNDVDAFGAFVDQVATSDNEKRDLFRAAAEYAMGQKRLDHAWLLSSSFEGLEPTEIELIEKYAREDPFVASSLITELDETANQVEAVNGMMRSWGSLDPWQAANWLRHETDDIEVSAETYRMLAREWANHGPLNLSLWISNLPQGENRDAAISQLLPKIAEDDPEAALIWTREISDSHLRDEMIKFVEQSH